MKITREELVGVFFDHTGSFKSKQNYLLEYLLKKTKCPEDKQDLLKHNLSNFLSSFKAKLDLVYHKKERFFAKYADWLQQMECFPSGKYPQKHSPGRPTISFEESSDRSKRRKTEFLREIAEPSSLCYASAMSLRTSGEIDAASAVQEISESPENAKKYKIALDSIAQNKPLSPDQALSFFINGNFSVRQYKLISKIDKYKFPSYNKVFEAKRNCMPSNDAITFTEQSAIVDLQEILNHTAKRIVKLQESVLNTIKSTPEDIHLILICKWGCDGSSGMSLYKQTFADSSMSDSSVFFTSFVPLRLVHQTDPNIIFWENPKPSSTRFCRPIRFIYTRETTDFTVQEVNIVNNAINTLEHLHIQVADKKFVIRYELLFTMIDNKVCNAVSSTSSSQRCYLCNATSSKFNDIGRILTLPINKEHTRFGLSVLHCWIRLFECIIHISYRLPFARWRISTPEQKVIADERKKNLQNEFYKQLGLIVDQPKQNYGSSNDGNTARRFFQNWELSSRITGVNQTLIKRFYYILIIISCGYHINIKEFKQYALKTAAIFVKLYPWVYMPTAVHKLLFHSAEIISEFIVPMGSLSEEAQENRNKDIKRFRLHFARKCSRIASIMDIFNRLLITSDPYISHLMEPQQKNKKNIPQEIKYLIEEPDTPDYQSYMAGTSSQENTSENESSSDSD